MLCPALSLSPKCPKPAQILPQSCPNPAPHLLRSCPKPAPNLPQTCLDPAPDLLNPAPNLPGFCPKPAPDLLRSCPKPVQILPQTHPRSAQSCPSPVPNLPHIYSDLAPNLPQTCPNPAPNPPHICSVPAPILPQTHPPQTSPSFTYALSGCTPRFAPPHAHTATRVPPPNRACTPPPRRTRMCKHQAHAKHTPGTETPAFDPGVNTPAQHVYVCLGGTNMQTHACPPLTHACATRCPAPTWFAYAQSRAMLGIKGAGMGDVPTVPTSGQGHPWEGGGGEDGDTGRRAQGLGTGNGGTNGVKGVGTCRDGDKGGGHRENR